VLDAGGEGDAANMSKSTIEAWEEEEEEGREEEDDDDEEEDDGNPNDA
jgi:hypothetical protein